MIQDKTMSKRIKLRIVSHFIKKIFPIIDFFMKKTVK